MQTNFGRIFKNLAWFTLEFLYKFLSDWKQNKNVSNSAQVISSIQKWQGSSWYVFTIFASFHLHCYCTEYFKIFILSPSFGGHCILYPCCCRSSVCPVCIFCKLMLFFFPSTTGHHCPLRKAPLTHSISELHDDQCPERQPGRELHDDHDCHPLFREKEYRRMLLLLSGDLSLSFYASLWDGVEGPGWVYIFSTGLGYAFRGEDPPEFIALGYLPEL